LKNRINRNGIILVAVDASSSSQQVAKTAIQIARFHQYLIHAVYVVDLHLMAEPFLN